MATTSESDRLKQSVLALQRMRARLDALERSRNEPIAIIGLGCRFPGGGAGPEGFWQMLRQGTDAVREVPPERWDVNAYFDPDPAAPGKIASRWGAFLDRVDEFDAAFFGITPREAAAMDPQQRLVLEVGWEALEDAAIAPDRLSGSATGVFLGMCTNDYAHLSMGANGAGSIDAYFPTGTAFSVAAGRLSYSLGLQGPSLVVDTACSSSLVAVHLACQSLRQGECRLALAGGVSLVLSPLSPLALSRLRMLAPDGRCKAFDAAADGFVQGEGCGLIALKRLSDARADGDRIRAIIRGSAVNQDGRSSGLTVPNGPAQMAVIRTALAAGNVDATQVRYVEAHGTGTSLGDPIEVRALTEVLAPGRQPGQWLALGSVKTNIGHLEAAAGIAGLIKTVLALQHGEIPPHLHLKQLNPHIALNGREVVFPAQPLAWPNDQGRRLAGVSSFGFSGTNAHVVLEEAPAEESRSETERSAPLHLLCLSARDEAALHELARCYARRVAGESARGLADCAYSALEGRIHFAERLAVLASDGAQAAELLEAAARGECPAGVWRGRGEPNGNGSSGQATAGTNPTVPGDSPAELELLLADLAKRYIRGVNINEAALHLSGSHRKVSLPSYPFQRERFWLAPSAHGSLAAGSPEHSRLLGRRLNTAAREIVFESKWNSTVPPLLQEHRIYDAVVVPAACQVALALAAAREVLGPTTKVLHDVLFREALVLSSAETRTIHLVLDPEEAGRASFGLSSLETKDGRETWIRHSSGKLAADLEKDPPSAPLPIKELESACQRGQSDSDWLYGGLRSIGIQLGPRFQWIETIGHGPEEAFATLRQPLPGEQAEGLPLPPGLIDACFQLLSATLAGPAESDCAYVPLGIDRLRFHALPPGPLVCHARLRSDRLNQESVTGDLCLADRNGNRVLEVEGLHVKRAARAALLRVEPHMLGGGSPPVRGPGASNLRQMLDEAPAEQRRELLLAHVNATAARVLGLNAARMPGPSQLLHEQGMDSLMAIELRDDLSQSTGLSLPATLLFNYPTPAALADFLAGKLLALAPTAAPRLPHSAVANEPIAIVGMGCRFPGRADGPAAFWDLLHRGVHACSEVPADRWDANAHYDPVPGTPGKMYTRHAAFLEGIDLFDAAFFGIAPREAAAMDPQQRLVLEVSWEALEDAAIAPDLLAGSATGVFLGMSTNDYAQLGLQTGDPSRIDVYSGTGGSFSVAAGRLSYLLGLQGPSLALDTACSSSLVAVHLACQSLRQGECRLALAGGVNLILAPFSMIALSQLRMLAPDGRCKTFDAAANGYVRGEGCGMIVLKRLSDAQADGDRILAMIRGSAVNQDGRSGGLTAPNGPAQEAVIRTALATAGVRGDEIGYVEAHGTGTALGDPIELQALANVLTPERSAERPFAVGAVKTNIGHLEAAAGIAGLIKAVLALQHAEVPPHLHLHRLNPHIHLDGLPVFIPTTPSSWPAGPGRRLAGVSAFGFSGTNAHVILEEAPATESRRVQSDGSSPLQLLCLSARDETALRALAARYAERIAGESAAGLADCAFTAHHGRAQFAERLVVIAADGPQAFALLQAAACGERPAGVWRGQAEPTPKTQAAGRPEESPTADWPERLADLAERYVRGEAIDWTSLDATDSRCRVHLPTYPFQRQRYWMQLPTRSSGYAPAGAAHRGEHPLLGRRLRSAVPLFEVELLGDGSSFLSDHQVNGAVVLPAAAYLEMALAAAPERPGIEWALDDVLLLEPLVLTGNQRHVVQTVLSAGETEDVTFRILSLAEGTPDETAEWTLHATGTLRRPASSPDAGAISPGQLRQRFQQSIPVDAYYAQLQASGIDYGPRFRALSELWAREGEALALIRLPDEVAAARKEYRLHPVLLDAGFHMLGAVFGGGADGTAALPAGLDRLRLHRPPEGDLWCHALARTTEGARTPSLTADVRLYDTAGRLVAEALGLHLRPLRESNAGLLPRWPDWLCTVEWTARPVVARRMPLDWVATPDDGADTSAGWFERHGLGAYPSLVPHLHALCAAYARQALDDLAQDDILPRYQRLLARLQEMRAEDGAVQPPLGDPVRLQQELAEEYPACRAELTLLWRCGPRLAEVMRGQCDPLSLLFPEGSMVDAEHLYQHSPFTCAVNALACAVLARTLVQLPAWRRLRVLEIGAGTGGTTAQLLPLLPADRTNYVFTDSSPRFLTHAAEKFRSCPFLRTQLLDLENDPGPQGFAEQSFDVVVAANVLHATARLRQSLDHVRQLLAPGGLLLLIEATGRQPLLDLTFGLLDGWWRFEDTDLRPDYPLLSRRQWLDLLGEAGFHEPYTLPSGPEVDAGSAQQLVFVARAPVPPDLAAEAGNWLIFADKGGMGRRLADQLTACGAGCTVVEADAPDAISLIAGSSWQNVVFLRTLDVTPPDRTDLTSLANDQRLVCGGLLRLVQTLAQLEHKPPRLWLVTRGAQGTGGPDRVSAAAATVWGLARVIAQEHPELRCASVDLDGTAGNVDEEAGLLLATLLADDGEDQVAWRGRRRLASRLTPWTAAPETPVPVQSDAVYVIVGGLGGLGLLTARWLVECGARRLVLAGRSAPSATAARIIAELEQTGARVHVVAADVSRPSDAARILAQAAALGGELRGVVHVAGVLDDGVLLQQDWQRFEQVMAPKVLGAWNLHVLTRNCPLDFFVLYSSAAALLGSSGQGNHAAANAFLDALAHDRRAQGLPALSIDWGPWSRVGVAAARQVERRFVRRGLGTITPRQGVEILAHLLGSAAGQVAVLPIHWPTFLAPLAAGAEPPLLTEMARAFRPAAVALPAPDQDDFLQRLRVVPPLERPAVLQELVGALASQVLQLEGAGKLDPSQPLHEQGLDSLMAVELRNALSKRMGSPLPATLLFNYPGIDSLAEYLATQVLFLPETAIPAAAPQPAFQDLSQEELAAQFAEELALIEEKKL